MASTRKLVYGVGVNDAGYPITIEEKINGKRILVWSCPFYVSWHHMLERCYSDKLHFSRPTYAGCAVVPEWRRFSAFRVWMSQQQWQGSHLDKDILLSGNKVYGPDTCVFVPKSLNNFLLDRSSARGEWPIGVYWDKQSRAYQARCRNPFTRNQEFLGCFPCPQEAHNAWLKRKHEHACRYADMQTDPRIAQALRARYAKNEGVQNGPR